MVPPLFTDTEVQTQLRDSGANYLLTIPQLLDKANQAVQGSEIVVAAPNTDYVMTYHKPANSPQLLARSFPRKEDRRVSMSLADFLTAACKLANDKARELGWIA